MEPYQFLVLPFVEIEIRLGTISRSKFDTSIDKKYFEKIKETLDSGDWISCSNKNTVEYIKQQVDDTKRDGVDYITEKMNALQFTKLGNLKLITDVTTNSKNENILMLKENVLTEDIQLNSSPFDIRYSINQEFNLKSQMKSFQKNDCVIRNKSRKSYLSDNFRYDLTIVNENIDGVIKTKYEIEIELLINKETLTWKTCYINDFIECKIYDLINIVEPMEREKFKLNLIKNKK